MTTKMFWYLCGPKNSNFGDLVGPWLYQKIKGETPQHIVLAHRCKAPELLITCGSVLQQWNMGSNWVIWGSGVYRSTEKFPIKPKRVCAVRGPLTRKLLMKWNIECPEIYGDPALLIPRFYTPQANKHQFKVGLLPHYSGYVATLGAFAHRAHDIKVIDVDRPIEQVCDDITSCQVTLSGSLHGIIVSHAYQVPCAWTKRMGREELARDRGDDIKYRDYYASVDVLQVNPLNLMSIRNASIEDIISIVMNYVQPKTMPDMDALLAACPFNNNN